MKFLVANYDKEIKYATSVTVCLSKSKMKFSVELSLRLKTWRFVYVQQYTAKSRKDAAVQKGKRMRIYASEIFVSEKQKQTD